MKSSVTSLDPKWHRLIEQVMSDGFIDSRAAFHPSEIILAKGSGDKGYYAKFIDKIKDLSPHASVTENLSQPHSQIYLKSERPGEELERIERGKRALVLGTISSAVERSDETGIVCPDYWHFSTVGFCWYNCAFCYLAGTKSIGLSPAIKIFLNIEDILHQLQRKIAAVNSPTIFYTGKLQDPLSLDQITNHTRILVPFFAEQEKGYLLFLTKTDAVENLLALREQHRGHTILSWSLNCKTACEALERLAPPLDARLQAVKRCSEAGYPMRFQFMPLIPIHNWQTHYEKMVKQCLRAAIPERITMGGICSYSTAKRLMEKRLGEDNLISQHLSKHESADGRIRYRKEIRIKMYRFLIEKIRSINPDIPVGLCLEEADVWEASGLDLSDAKCNCIFGAANHSRN